ncbi:nucleotide sugar dehydrogenase [Nocardioides sambongensis]|uniref:nucleotide sugar dehydrogenase n=1 Tax=Nocardioides sambongensis TaxID=2589074 RepID=UPI00112C853F|nr:nucleotide sugar dehydrogenase [Nocardioides sambongensis]
MDPVARFRDEAWTAGVIGLGYVGLPLAVAAADAGLDVIGFDISDARVRALEGGHSHVGDVSDAELATAVSRGVRFTTDASELSKADAIFIAVPSPLGRNRQPDTSFIESAAKTLAEVARPGQLISLESTTYPGTTEEIIVPALEAAGLVLDRDVFVCFSPERVDPGNTLRTADIAKVVGGVTPLSGEVAAAAYGRLVVSVHQVSTARAAELTKLLENTYRAVNIALANELAQISHAFDVDVWEVVDAAATKPFGFQAFYPGPGVGGHCIPLDPQYLAWRAREKQVTTRFIDVAEDINVHMPDWVVERIRDVLNERGLAVNGTSILLVGMAYKRNISDDRESPSVDVMHRLGRLGGRLGLLDPLVDPDTLARHGHEVVTEVTPSTWDLAVVLTDHDGLDYTALAAQVPVVFDTRGVYRRRGVEAANVVLL